MVTAPAARRLLIPIGMAALLLLSLAYWWLDNVPHEIFGTSMFALIAWHIFLNRSWFGNLPRGRYDGRRVFTVLMHLFLIVNMAVLLATSIAISKLVLAVIPFPENITLREFHWFAAYWVIIIVGIHVGLHWVRVMALLRTLFGLSRKSAVRRWALRLLALLGVGFGIWSVTALGVWGKLTFTYSLEFWDFTASIAPFFLHWAAVIALPAILTHYLMAMWVHPLARAHRLPVPGTGLAEPRPARLVRSANKCKRIYPSNHT